MLQEKQADISGDCLQDIVLLYSGNVDYWPNLGYGNWAKHVHIKNSPVFPHGYDPRRILIGDVDGDGLADIIYVEDRQITLWINQSGNAWSDPGDRFRCGTPGGFERFRRGYRLGIAATKSRQSFRFQHDRGCIAHDGVYGFKQLRLPTAGDQNLAQRNTGGSYVQYPG